MSHFAEGREGDGGPEPLDRLRSYFAHCARRTTRRIGAEIETSFEDKDGRPISHKTAEAIFRTLAEAGWRIAERKGPLITKLEKDGNTVSFELGRQNLEIATKPLPADAVVAHARSVLDELYRAAERHGAKPRFEPVFEVDEDLLVIPDKRDQTWLDVDGRAALAPLARTSSVQYTVDVSPETAIASINRLHERLDDFLADYPQEHIWREYIRSSKAGYLPDRYGGPGGFKNIADYCAELARHDIVTPKGLVPLGDVAQTFDVPLFVRSVWWYFRLRRCGDTLAIEVRPLARRGDEKLDSQLALVLDAMRI